MQLRWAAHANKTLCVVAKVALSAVIDRAGHPRLPNGEQPTRNRSRSTSILASGGLTVAKGAVGLLTGSLAILSEAAHSLIDFGATLMTYFAVRVSGKPADEEHHYGHGKVESVTALAETALLFVLSGVVIWEAAKRLLGGPAMWWRRRSRPSA